MRRTSQVMVSMVAYSLNSPTSNPASAQASKTKAIPYKRLEDRNKAVASHTHSKSCWTAQTCLRFVLGFRRGGDACIAPTMRTPKDLTFLILSKHQRL